MIEKIKQFIFKAAKLNFLKKNKLKELKNFKEARILFLSLENQDKNKVRFVGGCVRKAINNEFIDDIDVATSIKPPEVKSKLDKAGIKVIDTGLSHGTVSAFINDKKFEITTLREDLVTDGRHANVQFTEDWQKDAQRRDITINSIYLNLNGDIYDPFNGSSDLKNGIVKFIGSSEDRIQEDYLRILRYLRFFTMYSQNDHKDKDILSIKKNINGLNKISHERIYDELKKILSLDKIYNLFSNNFSKEIITNIFPQFKYYTRLKKLNFLDQNIRSKLDNKIILALLIIDKSDNFEYFCYKYKASNKTKNRLKNISRHFELLNSKNFFSEHNIKKLIYSTNKDSVKDLLFFSIFESEKIDNKKINQLLNYIENCEIPKFPISGEYLKERGFETGEELGKKLKMLEKKWIENNFNLDQKLLEKSLNKLNSN
jgi:tRNA nucleotidyltransferase/poly(A) polymerase